MLDNNRSMIDFNSGPFITFWEVTRACALACRHCRAVAQTQRHPQELNTDEGFNLINDIVAIGTPLLIITGGDPMMRPDISLFISHATKQGLRVALAPSATRLVNLESLREAREAGLARISISLDGSTAKIHDSFRQTTGSYEQTNKVIKHCIQASLPFQINTAVSKHNLSDLKQLYLRVTEFSPVLWDLFFLVPTGRADREDLISAREHEEVFHWLYELSLQIPFDIKTTSAPHYRRVQLQRTENGSGLKDSGTDSKHTSHGSTGRVPGINDGKGCCFISHLGDVYPSGFLPLKAGNIRQQSLPQIYGNSSIFRNLRDPSKLKGKCGICEYNQICGGSRARAYALTGDYLAAEPCCVYQPAN